MMKKRMMLLAGLLAIGAMLMTACTQPAPAPAEPQQSDTAQAEETQTEEVQAGETPTEDTQSAGTPVEITAAYLPEEEFAELDAASATMLGNPDMEYVSHVLIRVSAPVTELKLWELSADCTEDGALLIQNVNAIGEAPRVTADDTLIVSVQESETLPWNGISFNDAAGEPHYLYLSWSGEDGHPFLTEYAPVP